MNIEKVGKIEETLEPWEKREKARILEGEGKLIIQSFNYSRFMYSHLNLVSCKKHLIMWEKRSKQTLEHASIDHEV